MDLLLAQYVRRSIGVTTSNVRIAKTWPRDVKSSSSVQRNMRGGGVHETSFHEFVNSLTGIVFALY